MPCDTGPGPDDVLLLGGAEAPEIGPPEDNRGVPSAGFDPAARRRLLTVNVEDYFQVGPVSRIVPVDRWDRFETRVEANTRAAMDLIEAQGATATFFVLGWIGERMPGLVREIAARGHEVACRGRHGQPVHTMSPAAFREDVAAARQALEDACGVAVRGYRAPRGWLRPGDTWALEILAELGFAYDSSLMPLGRRFARRGAARFAHHYRLAGRTLHAFPVSSVRIGAWDLPFAGGNYLRQLPEGFVSAAIAAWDRQVPTPLVFYFHVWELDPDQPRIQGPGPIGRLRQYRNLEAMPGRIGRCLARYPFQSVARHLRLPPAAATGSARPAVAAGRVAAGPRAGVTIVVPCHNEEAALPYLARTLDSVAGDLAGRYRFHYVFVDDGSTDGTARELRRLFGGRDDCTILRHDRNRGVAAATMTGIRAARTEIVATIDCDCSYDPRQLGRMLPMLRPGIDVVTASPYHADGKAEGVPPWRLVLSRSLSLLYRRATGVRLATFTSCFRVYRRGAVAGLELRHGDFLGITEILFRMHEAGSGIAECPAVLEGRLLGRSKMKILRTAIGHLGLLAGVRRSRTPGTRPRLATTTREKLDA